MTHARFGIPTASTVGPVYAELRAMLPPGSRFGLTFSDRPTPGGPPNVGLELIELPAGARGSRTGDAVLTRLCEHADTHRWLLTLRVTAAHGGDPDRLRAWYRRHGFVGQGRNLVRHPVPPSP